MAGPCCSSYSTEEHCAVSVFTLMCPGGNRSRKRALPATQLDDLEEDVSEDGAQEHSKPGRKSEPDMAAADTVEMPPPYRRRRSSGKLMRA